MVDALYHPFLFLLIFLEILPDNVIISVFIVKRLFYHVLFVPLRKISNKL